MNTRTKTTISIILIVVLAGGGAFALWEHTRSAPSAEETEADSSESQGNLPQEKRDAEKNSQAENDEKTVTDDTEEDTSEHSDISILLNNFGQQDNGTVYANATVSGTREGTCVFRFTHNGSSFSETTDIEQAPTGYYACSVRLNGGKFIPKGSWTVRAHIQDTQPRTESETKEAEIE